MSTVLGKLALSLRVQLRHAVGVVHRLTLVRQAKVLGQFHQRVADFDSAQGPSHREAVKDKTRVRTVHPLHDGDIKLRVVCEHSGA